jgi:hypothetical protein
VKMFRVLELSGSAKPTVFAAVQCLVATFIVIAVMVGCADIRRANIEPPTAGTLNPEHDRVPHGTGASAAPSIDELQEIVTTSRHRKPPLSTQPGQGHAASAHAPAPATAAAPAAAAPAASAASAAMETAPPSPEAGEKPRYEARLTNPVVTREHDEVLSVAVSTKLSADDLRELVNTHLKSATKTGERTTPPAAPADAHGDLETAVWYQFAFVLAKIECPDFLDCGGSVAQARSNDPLIWDWSLSAKKSDASRTGNIIVRFYGDQSAGGKFEQGIAALPPLQIEVSVERDLSYWNGVAKQLSDLFSQFKAILITLGAIVAILIGWKKQIWKLFRRS